MGLRFIILALLMLVCTMLCLFFISVSITSRIRLLAQNMHNYNHEDPILIPASLHQDEIGTLIDEYNNLITHIRDLQLQRERQEKELRSSELRILRAQMNPHFLYNTLEMLRWYAGNHDKAMVDEIIRQLSTFYKLSLNHGLEYYLVEDEVLLLKTYFNIMNMRYQNTMRFETTVDPEILPCRIPIILLQPILENAIMHGILLTPGKSGSILFTGAKEGSTLRFSFLDDGVGIDPSTMDAINHGTFHYARPKGSGGNSIGIRNIAGRIRLLYGEEYGLTYSRPLSGGTLVVIRIPADDAN
ncbi:MAG: histidine kinase [Roseburia sp.]|jgi:two-component system sensor histidine kinase YesM|nr:histidine kinase [Roseburia sp.]